MSDLSPVPCGHDPEDNWFDRTLCPEPCGSMHTRCGECGRAHGRCPLDRTDRKCDRCRNWLSICGHDLPFTERMRTIALPTSWAKDSH